VKLLLVGGVILNKNVHSLLVTIVMLTTSPVI